MTKNMYLKMDRVGYKILINLLVNHKILVLNRIAILPTIYFNYLIISYKNIMIFYSSVFNETLKKIVKNYQANKGKIQKRS